MGMSLWIIKRNGNMSPMRIWWWMSGLFFRWKSWMGCESSMSCLNALKFKFHSCYLPYFSSYITLAFNFRSMCRISKEISYNINVYQINQWRILCTFISFEGNKHMICKKKMVQSKNKTLNLCIGSLSSKYSNHIQLGNWLVCAYIWNARS